MSVDRPLFRPVLNQLNLASLSPDLYILKSANHNVTKSIQIVITHETKMQYLTKNVPLPFTANEKIK